MSGLTKSSNYKFFYGSCDPNGAVKLNKLADVFAQLADEQVDEIKIRYPFLNNSRYRWILVRYQMQIRRMLFAEEPISVLTYQSQYTKYMCLRDYAVTDSCGNEPIFAQCQWVLVDQETGHISAVPREYESLTEKEKYRGSQFPKLSDISAKNSSFIPIQTRWCDYDYNGHVNNTVYFSFLSLFENSTQLADFKPVSVDIHYKTGMFLGKQYNLYTESTEKEGQIILDQTVHGGDETAALMRSVWEKKEK